MVGSCCCCDFRTVHEYLLNETQAIFLGTLFRTASKKKDDPVLLFKAKLAKEFVVLRDENLRLQKHKALPEYKPIRDAGKIVRKQTTDMVQQFVEYATEQGSSNANFYYQNISKMLNGMLFIVEGKFKNLREVMSIQQLMTISSAEQIVDKGLQAGMSHKKYYKEIYKDVKVRVETFAELHGKSEVIQKALDYK